MGEYFLKNPTPSVIRIDDLGYEIASNQSVTIDENDFDGFLTPDMISSLNNGLVLSKTDIGDASGDFPTQIAIEKLTLKSTWRPKVSTFNNLPVIGNEHADIRLVEDTGILYWWNSNTVEWIQLTSTFSLTVTEYDEEPSGTHIQKLVFVDQEDAVYIDEDFKTAYIGAPSEAPSMNGQNLIIEGTTLVTGRLSQNNINYKSGDPAGTNVSYIIKDGTFTIKTPIDANNGDKGLIKIYINQTTIATIDLGINFVVTNRDGNQNLNDYDHKGSGDIIINGAVTLPYGYFELIKVGKYNNFKYYQTWQAQFVLADPTQILRQGWNEIYITHEGLASGTQTSNKIDLFYDIDTVNPTVNTPTVVQNTPVIKWLSGVKFYDTGSTWNVNCIAYDAFDNVYHSSNAPVIFQTWPGLTATPIEYFNTSVAGVSSPPIIDEIMNIQNWILTQTSNQMSENARLEAVPRDPYGSYTSKLTASENIMVFSYTNQSTPLKEYFRDESYRLPVGEYNTIPTTITGLWDSQGNLDIYDTGNGLQVYMDKLVYPKIDFSNTKPTGNPNYAPLGLEQNKFYYRAFKSTVLSRAQGTLRITGITKQDMINNKIKVWIKVPSQTGWLSLNKDYNYATFTGIDEDGCWMYRDSQTNSDFVFGLDKFRTEFGGYMVIVKILYPIDNGAEITHLEITDW